MHHRTGLRALPWAAFATAALLPLLAAGCASAGAATGDGGSAAADPGDLPELPPTGIKVGWMTFRPVIKPGQVTSLTLLSEGSPEGKKISSGRARMDGGKVVPDREAQDIVVSFEKYGFGRFAVNANPHDGPAGAMEVVWIDRGNGYESLFLLPGQRQNPETRDAPDVFFQVKSLVLEVHRQTFGSSVHVGQGWTGEELLDQKPGEIGK